MTLYMKYLFETLINNNEKSIFRNCFTFFSHLNETMRQYKMEIEYIDIEVIKNLLLLRFFLLLVDTEMTNMNWHNNANCYTNTRHGQGAVWPKYLP